MMANFWFVLKQAAWNWLNDKASQLGAALAFYSVLSIAPLVVIAIAIAGFFFGEEAARHHVVEQFRSMVGAQGAEAIQEMLVHARRPGAGLVASVLGLAVLFLGAAGVFGQLQDSLNTIWEVQSKSWDGLLAFLRRRFLSIVMVLGTGFLLLVSLILTAAMAAISGRIGSLLPSLVVTTQILNVGLSFGMVTILFALIFKILPDVKIAWKDVWIGALLTATLFLVGKYLIGLYLALAAPGSTYGAAGSLVVLVLWVYYSSQILFFGAEVTHVYANLHDPQTVPARGAEPLPQTSDPKP